MCANRGTAAVAAAAPSDRLGLELGVESRVGACDEAVHPETSSTAAAPSANRLTNPSSQDRSDQFELGLGCDDDVLLAGRRVGRLQDGLGDQDGDADDRGGDPEREVVATGQRVLAGVPGLLEA